MQLVVVLSQLYQLLFVVRFNHACLLLHRRSYVLLLCAQPPHLLFQPCVLLDVLSQLARLFLHVNVQPRHFCLQLRPPRLLLLQLLVALRVVILCPVVISLLSHPIVAALASRVKLFHVH